MSFLRDGRKNNMENYEPFNGTDSNYAGYFVSELLKKRYVLDASVISKWYYGKDEEDLYNAAAIYDNLQSKKYTFFAPDLLIFELLNIFRTKPEVSDAKINKIINELYDLIVILGINKNTFKKAFLISRNLNISFYDSIYLSLAEDIDAGLLTADKKLFNSAKAAGINITMLSDF